MSKSTRSILKTVLNNFFKCSKLTSLNNNQELTKPLKLPKTSVIF